MEKNEPIYKIRKEAVQAALFEREAQGKDGLFKSHSVVLQVSYRKDGEWVNNSITVVKKNIGRVIECLQEVQKNLPQNGVKRR